MTQLKYCVKYHHTSVASLRQRVAGFNRNKWPLSIGIDGRIQRNKHQWLKVLKEARDKPNPYLKDIAAFSNLDAEITKDEAEITSLKNKGYLPLSVFERFQKAGMIPEYRSLYNFLSNDAHSNIRALVDRHLEISGKDFQVVFYKDEPLEAFVIYLDSATSMLIDASKKIHEFFQTGFLPQMQALDEKFTQIRSRY